MRQALRLVVCRKTDLGIFIIRVRRLEDALYWASLLSVKYGERVWIEKDIAPAHRSGLVLAGVKEEVF